MDGLLISGGTLLTMDGPDGLVEHGAVLIEDGRVTYAGAADAPDMPPVDGARRLDARGGLILPGLINSHTHAAMTLLRGVADDLDLQIWLTEHIFPLESNLTAEAVYAGARLACLEMIKNGVTSFCDMYLFAPQTAKAADESGLRAVVGEVVYDFPSSGYGELENGLRLTRDLIRQWADHPRVRAAVMPHALYTCAPSLLEAAGRISQDLEADINIHLAENPAETAQVKEMYGKRPLEHLESLGLLNSRLWVDHAVDLTQEEIERLAAAGVRVSHCPESNMKLASGVMKLDAMLGAGVAVGLGTDGCASNNDLDILGEMDTCAKLHKVSELKPTAATAQSVLELATRLGGKAFGNGELGVLKPGALGDVIVIDTNQPHLTPMYNPVSHLVYSARGGDVIHTVCHGRVLMQDRAVTTLDEAEVMAKAVEAAHSLRGGS